MRGKTLVIKVEICPKPRSFLAVGEDSHSPIQWQKCKLEAMPLSTLEFGKIAKLNL